jgi:hypothetical protein
MWPERVCNDVAKFDPIIRRILVIRREEIRFLVRHFGCRTIAFLSSAVERLCDLCEPRRDMRGSWSKMSTTFYTPAVAHTEFDSDSNLGLLSNHMSLEAMTRSFCFCAEARNQVPANGYWRQTLHHMQNSIYLGLHERSIASSTLLA